MGTPELVEVRLLQNANLVDSWAVDLAGGGRTRIAAEWFFSAEDRPAVMLSVEAMIADDQHPEDNVAARMVTVW